MVKLFPITQEQASPFVDTIYQRIRRTFSLESVPLIFQYIANAEDYLAYIWERTERNVAEKHTLPLTEKLEEFASSSIDVLYEPSADMKQFVAKLAHEERVEIEHTVVMLLRMNAFLLLFTLDLREGLKGVSSQQKQLDADVVKKMDFWDDGSVLSENNSDSLLQDAVKMLLPVFGSQGLRVIKYPTFFSLVTREMEEVAKKEAYLTVRVGLEQIALLLAKQIPYSTRCSYHEFMDMVPEDNTAYRLLYLLKHTFPEASPKLLLMSALMQKALRKQ